MKRFIHPGILIMVIFAFFIITSCFEDILQKEPSGQVTGEFVIFPQKPVSKDIVKMITHDCKYNILASVTSKGKEITVKKRFNSQMKWPCILRYDTIPLGKLSHGNYKVSLLIVDINPFVKDSIAIDETVELAVGK